MSDVMLLGVLRMPMDNPDPMTLRQFVARARQAACRIEADSDEIDELRAECEALRKDAERYRWIRDSQHYWEDAGIVRLCAGPDFDRAMDDELDAIIDKEMAPKSYTLGRG